MACLKSILKISNCVLLRNANILPYTPIINSLHIFSVDNTLLGRKHRLFDQDFIRRTLYTNEGLGIDKFEVTRNLTRQQYLADAADSFRTKMRELLDRSNKTHVLVFKQDLERAIYLCDNQEDQVQLLKEMATKFCAQNSNLRFGTFKFGPVLLRLCFVLDRPDLAMELVSNPELEALFSSPTCYQLLMALLYRHQLYSEVLDLMDQLATGRLMDQRYPRSCVMLALASALQMGTEEGYSRGLALVDSANAASKMPRRFDALAGTIALRAGRPDTAIKLLNNTQWPAYYTIRNIVVLAWCELGRLDQVVALLRPLSLQDSGGSHTDRGALFRDTYDKVKAAVEDNGDPAFAQEFARIEKALLDRRLISKLSLLKCVLEPLEGSEAAPRYSHRETAYNRGSLMRTMRGGSVLGRRRESLMDESGR